MKVYILMDVDYDGATIIGVYYKLEDAQKEMGRQIEQTKQGYILAYGDKWERYFYNPFEIVEKEIQ